MVQDRQNVGLLFNKPILGREHRLIVVLRAWKTMSINTGIARFRALDGFGKFVFHVMELEKFVIKDRWIPLVVTRE